MTPEERKVYARQYYLKNKEKIKERSRLRYEQNWESMKTYGRQYYWDNREDRLAYYQRNKDRVSIQMRQRYIEGKAYLDAIKVERGCVDCGYREHAGALHFDHIDPLTKEGRGVSFMKNYKRSRIDAEVAKCEVRCANCHAIRTETEEHWRVRDQRSQGVDELTPPTLFDG